MSRFHQAHLERRGEPRVALDARARVFQGQGLALWADCVIKDLSASGAKIELSHVHKLSPRFVLLHLEAGNAFEVILKWRRGDLAGMSLERTHALVAPTVEPHLVTVREAWMALQPNRPPAP
ncbi:PilZ domain-containing protein [Phenylobacterium sp.]|uniref:PilZ domain-containing protein n=1 Tax=Phenylobacterium sp. TaxID=1871053 RepID=UPI0025CFC474|nr:PilZ domain-containing protein [Phenylobacterium sp.]